MKRDGLSSPQISGVPEIGRSEAQSGREPSREGIHSHPHHSKRDLLSPPHKEESSRFVDLRKQAEPVST